MKKYTIESNEYLSKATQAYYSKCYKGMGKTGNPDYINDLKNTFSNFDEIKLKKAEKKLKKVLLKDLPKIIRHMNISSLVICVVPRAKAEKSYKKNQLIFKKAVRKSIRKLSNNTIDGTDYIKRNIDTKTTHLQKAIESGKMDNYNNRGELPYSGIALDTCDFSNEIYGKNILLIDDIYTNDVNIDEDVIQALLDKGAKSVAFYAIARTV